MQPCPLLVEAQAASEERNQIAARSSCDSRRRWTGAAKSSQSGPRCSVLIKPGSLFLNLIVYLLKEVPIRRVIEHDGDAHKTHLSFSAGADAPSLIAHQSVTGNLGRRGIGLLVSALHAASVNIRADISRSWVVRPDDGGRSSAGYACRFGVNFNGRGHTHDEPHIPRTSPITLSVVCPAEEMGATFPASCRQA